MLLTIWRHSRLSFIAARNGLQRDTQAALVLGALLSSLPFDADTSWPPLDHRPETLDYREERRDRERRLGKGKKLGYRRLYPPSETLVPSKADGLVDRRAAAWNRGADFPNPLAPGAYIDFRRLNSTREILEALEESQDCVQLRQIVAALTRMQSGGFAVGPRAVQSIVDLARTTIGSARMEDVVGMFLACARFRVIDRANFFDDLAKLTIERGYPRSMSIRELATMIHACGTILRLSEKRIPLRIARSKDAVTRSASPPSGFEDHGEFASGMAAVEELLDLVVEEFAAYREADEEMELRLPSVIKSLSFLGRKDERLDRLIENLASSFTQLRSASEEKMAALIFAVANSGSIKRDVVDRLATEVTKLERLKSLSTSQLIGIIDAFSQLEELNRGVWISVLAELRQKTRLEEMTRTQWRVVIRSLVASEMIRDRELVSEIFATLLSRERLLEIGAMELIRCISALGGSRRFFRIPGGDAVLPIVADRGALNNMSPESFRRFVRGLFKFHFDGRSRILPFVRNTREIDAALQAGNPKLRNDIVDALMTFANSNPPV